MARRTARPVRTPSPLPTCRPPAQLIGRSTEQPAGFHIDMDDIEHLRLTKKNLQKMFFDEVLALHRPFMATPNLGLEAPAAT